MSNPVFLGNYEQNQFVVPKFALKMLKVKPSDDCKQLKKFPFSKHF